VVEGEVQEGRRYSEAEFNRIIDIELPERQRVEILLNQIDPHHKTLVFCATQEHALAFRDLINQLKSNKDSNYCHRVTADDGEICNTWLRAFQDNEKTIPTILTTSQKLSTGVDARNVRNIVLLRQVNSMIEFKQIIGRGTRLYDGKDYFTILDFVKAYQHFSDPEWDGEPPDPDVINQRTPGLNQNPKGDDDSKGGDEPGDQPRRTKRGVQELAQEKLTPLLRLRYQNSIADAVADLGNPEEIGQLFSGFQRFLYATSV